MREAPLTLAAVIRVTELWTTPVKGTRLRARDEIELERHGARDNRRFYLVDADGTMVNGKGAGALTSVVASYDAGLLTLEFPDGSRVAGPIEPGDEIPTRFFSRTVKGRLVAGPFSEAISAHAGERLRLVQAHETAVDRGKGGGVSLISRASLARLAAEARQESVDPRRFRMLVEIDGTEAHEEDGWVGRRVRIGAALVEFSGHVGRCLVTSRDPERGEIDLPTLDILRGYRANTDTTEPVPFGIYGRVIEPGTVRVGDEVAPAS